LSHYDRLFARVYDRSMAGSEEAGPTEKRVALLAAATGRVLELGAGTGLNVVHYPPAVRELVLTEPDEPMLRRLAPRVAASRPRASTICAPAEQLPFEAGSFDTVVSTLTPIWRRIGRGCHPNRATAAAIEAAGLELDDLERGRFPQAPRFVEPLAMGAAVKPG